MMDFTPSVSADSQLINGYGDMGFTIAGTRHEGSVLVFPKRTLPWSVSSMAELSPESLSAIADAEARPGVLLLGCGKSMSPIPRTLRERFRALGVVIEPMDTGAACRTFNVLLSEGRDAAVALIAV